MRMVFLPGRAFNCSRKASPNLSRLLASRKPKLGHFLKTVCNLSEMLMSPPNLSTLKLANP